MTAAAKKHPGRGRTGASAALVLEVAEDLFARHGYDATSMRQIADAAGVKEPNLYRVFDTKENLYKQVLARGIKPINDQVAQETGRGDDINALLTVASRMMRLHASHPNIARLLQRELVQGEAMTAVARECFEHMFAYGADFNRPFNPQVERDFGLWLLQALAIMNISFGFLASEPLYRQLTGRSIYDEDVLAEQCRLMDRFFRASLLDI